MANVLTINAGSSSIRFAIFGAGQQPTRLLQGKMDRIRSGDATLTVGHGDSAPPQINADIKDPAAAIDFLLDFLELHPFFKTLDVVAHLVVLVIFPSAPP